MEAIPNSRVTKHDKGTIARITNLEEGLLAKKNISP
jgi:hypothetical protein